MALDIYAAKDLTLASMSEKFCGLVNCRRISNIEVSSSASGSTS